MKFVLIELNLIKFIGRKLVLMTKSVVDVVKVGPH